MPGQGVQGRSRGRAVDLAGKGEKKANNKITFVYHRVGVGIMLDYDVDVDVDEQSRAEQAD